MLLYVTSPSSSSARLELLAHRGLDGSSVEKKLAQIDLASGIPASEVVTLRQAIFVEAGSYQLDGSRPTAAVPLLVGQRAIGSLSLSFGRDRVFGPDERSFLITLARQCAQALDRARLYEAERRARELSQKNDELYRLIARATKEVFWDWDVAGGTVSWSV